MRITFSDTGKRFNRDWIFRRMSYEFSPGNSYAITGANGSGKSTLLQVISGSMAHSEGTIVWQADSGPVEVDSIYAHLSIVAPYLDVIEEMTATEFLTFHRQFKPLLPGITVKNIISEIGLEKAANKQIRYYSSGMKQRIKLAQAVFTNNPLLLLDEPCTNLDATGYELYHQLIKSYCANKTIIVSSNDTNEYSFCQHQLSIMDYK